jgi:hypothetical protein
MTNGFIFVDEAGDPGQPFSVDEKGSKTPTGASPFYIITAICLDEKKLFLLEQQMMEIKNRFGYKKEIKSNEISLPLYKALLGIINHLDIKTHYRLIDKNTYKGKFKVDGIPALHNVFDEYNVARAVAHAIVEGNLESVEVIIDRTDRRLLDGRFDSFNSYLVSKVKKYVGSRAVGRVSHVTHVDSRYVNAMQMSDIICGAIRDNFTKKNQELIKVIAPERLVFADRKYEKIVRKIKGKKERGAPTPGTPLSSKSIYPKG